MKNEQNSMVDANNSHPSAFFEDSDNSAKIEREKSLEKKMILNIENVPKENSLSSSYSNDENENSQNFLSELLENNSKIEEIKSQENEETIESKKIKIN